LRARYTELGVRCALAPRAHPPPQSPNRQHKCDHPNFSPRHLGIEWACAGELLHAPGERAVIGMHERALPRSASHRADRPVRAQAKRSVPRLGGRPERRLGARSPWTVSAAYCGGSQGPALERCDDSWDEHRRYPCPMAGTCSRQSASRSGNCSAGCRPARRPPADGAHPCAPLDRGSLLTSMPRR
jgi:hypothetical protein